MDLINSTEQEIAQALGVEMPQEDEQAGAPGGPEGSVGERRSDGTTETATMGAGKGYEVRDAAEQEPADPAEGQSGGENPQSPAAPATAPFAKGAEGQGQEEADEEDEEDEGAGEAPSGPADHNPREGEADEGAGKPLSAEERRANAARRRQQETQAAIDAAVNAARAKWEQEQQQREQQLFTDANLKNSITGQPITNREEFYAWKDAFDNARLQKNLQAGKLTPEDLEQAIAANPAVRRMKEAAERQAQADRQRQQAEMKARVDREIAEIGKMDPGVKTLEDIVRKPTGRAFAEYVQRGNTFLDAYRLANWAELTARQQQAADQQVQAAKQQATANARSKGHLNPVPTSRGEGASPVPEAELRVYRALLGGDATEAEIRSSYNDYMKSAGR